MSLITERSEKRVVVSMLVPPIILSDYPEEDSEFRIILEKMGEKRAGEVLKALVCKELMQSFDTILSDMDKAYERAVVSFSRLNEFIDTLRSESFLDEAEHLYGPVLVSNLSYALRNLAALLNLFSTGLKQWSQIPDNMKRNSIESMKTIFMELDVSGAEDMPDAVSVAEEQNRDAGMTVLLFNVTLFVTMVVFVGFLIRGGPRLNASTTADFELLLRNWTQEILTQQFLLAEENHGAVSPVPLRGIVPDDEDLEINRELYLAAFDDGSE